VLLPVVSAQPDLLYINAAIPTTNPMADVAIQTTLFPKYRSMSRIVSFSSISCQSRPTEIPAHYSITIIALTTTNSNQPYTGRSCRALLDLKSNVP